MKRTGTTPHSPWLAVKSGFSGVSQMTRTGLFSAPTVLRNTSEAHQTTAFKFGFQKAYSTHFLIHTQISHQALPGGEFRHYTF
jgi:hypothetical protein